MSGAAALASARRRRAAPQNPVPPSGTNVPPPAPASNQNGNRATDNRSQVSQNNGPGPRQTPAQMLLSHNTLIQNLQQVVSTLNEVVDKNVLPKEEMEQMIYGKINEGIAAQRMSNTNISFFKDKYNAIEEQMKEIKKHVLKIQSFAMDTNLQCIELKKRMNRDKMYKTIEEVREADKNILSVSPETRQEHLYMLKNNTALNKILEQEDSNVKASTEPEVEETSDSVVNTDEQVEANGGDEEPDADNLSETD